MPMWTIKFSSIIRYLPIFSFRTLNSSSKLSLSLNAFMLCSEEAPTRLPYLISNEQNSIFSLSSFSSIFNLSIASSVLPVTLCPCGPPVRHNNLLFLSVLYIWYYTSLLQIIQYPGIYSLKIF